MGPNDKLKHGVKHVRIFTDGSCDTASGEGGWGYLLTYNGARKVQAGYEANTTNNRMELIERVQAKGATLVTEANIVGARGHALELRIEADSRPSRVEIGDVLLIAIGPRPVRDCIPVLEAAAVPYELAGDCYRPGDFLTALRDAWLVALAVEHRAAAELRQDSAHGHTTVQALRGGSH